MSDELFETLPGLPSANKTPSGVRPGLDPQILEFNESEVTPEEQAQYEQFFYRAKDFVSQQAEAVIDQMNDRKVPVYKNVGKTALMIAQGVEKTARSAGKEIAPEIMLAAGEEIVEMLMELGDKAKIWPFDADSRDYTEAMNMALMYGAELAGKEVLAGPDAAQMTEEAGNVLAQQVAAEHEAGQTPDGFFESLQGHVAGGVNRAVNGG